MIASRLAPALAALVGFAMAAIALASLGLRPVGARVRLGAIQPQGGEDPAPDPGAAAVEVAVGDPAPPFDLPEIGGGRVALEEARGQNPVLLVVWAVWCPPCIAEFEELKRLHVAYEGRGLRILAVGVRYHQGLEEVRGFARDLRVSFPVLYDDEEKLVQRYGISYIPSNYLIDRSGVIRMAESGLPPDIDAQIETVLAGS